LPGTFILSLDTEIAWGTYGAADVAARAASFDVYRDLICRLLDLLDRYQIPATWAVVGHLLLDACDGHPDLPQPHYVWADAPDADRDPCTDAMRDPWYYGPDVIAAIRAAQVEHEIGTHTFTHVLAGDAAVTPAIWEAQLAACAALHREHGLPMHALVYPQNRVAYVDRLAAHGITVYRGQEARPYRRSTHPAARLLSLLDYALSRTPPTYAPSTLAASGPPLNLPASQFLLSYDGVRRFIPTGARIRQARRGLDQAIRRGEIYHLWFHPFNLGSGAGMFDALAGILKLAAARRDAGDLQVLTMGAAADWIRAQGESNGAG
jgi:hypothetical protein